MNDQYVRNVIEAALLAAGRPLAADELMGLFDERDGSAADEGRRGVTVTFVAILELLREGLIEIVQSEAYGPLHVRLGNPARHLKLVADDDAGTAAAANDDLARNQ